MSQPCQHCCLSIWLFLSFSVVIVSGFSSITIAVVASISSGFGSIHQKLLRLGWFFVALSGLGIRMFFFLISGFGVSPPGLSRLGWLFVALSGLGIRMFVFLSFPGFGVAHPGSVSIVVVASICRRFELICRIFVEAMLAPCWLMLAQVGSCCPHAGSSWTYVGSMLAHVDLKLTKVDSGWPHVGSSWCQVCSIGVKLAQDFKAT